MYIAMNYVILSRWAVELAEATKRPFTRILSGGLDPKDFPDQEVNVQFADGSRLSFNNAFVVTNAERNEMAVFSRKDGYYEFPCNKFAITVKPMPRADPKPLLQRIHAA